MESVGEFVANDVCIIILLESKVKLVKIKNLRFQKILRFSLSLSLDSKKRISLISFSPFSSFIQEH